MIELDFLLRQKAIFQTSILIKNPKIKINSDDYLPLEKTPNMHNVVALVKSVFNKNQNHYYYQTFLEKGSYK